MGGVLRLTRGGYHSWLTGREVPRIMGGWEVLRLKGGVPKGREYQGLLGEVPRNTGGQRVLRLPRGEVPCMAY